MNRVESITDLVKEVLVLDSEGLPVGKARKVVFSIVNLKEEKTDENETEDKDYNRRRTSRSSFKGQEENIFNANLDSNSETREASFTNISARNKENINESRIIVKGRDRKSTNNEICEINQRDNHKEQIPRGTTRRRKKTNCTCTTTTKIEAKPSVFLSIHNRKKKKPKTMICPLGNKNRTKTITYIKNRFQRGEGSMITELQASKHKRTEAAIARMWHYIDNTTYIFKQKGSKEDILSLVYELENLMFAIDIGVEQLDRWLKVDHRDKHMEDDLDVLLIAEKTEAILEAEWTN